MQRKIPVLIYPLVFLVLQPITRDAVEWMLPPLWPWKVLMLPARGPRPALEDVTVPQATASLSPRSRRSAAEPLPAPQSPPKSRPSLRYLPPSWSKRIHSN